MNFHIPTAMQLTATMSMIIGLALALTVTGYPKTLRQPMRLWVRGLLIQPFSFVLFSLRGGIPDWLSIIVGNTLLVIAFAHVAQALRIYNRKSALKVPMLALFGITIIGICLLTYVWPSLYGRIILISLVLAVAGRHWRRCPLPQAGSDYATRAHGRGHADGGYRHHVGARVQVA